VRRTCLSSTISLSENPSEGEWGPIYVKENVCNTRKFLLPWQLSTQKHHAHWLVSFLWPLPAAPAICFSRNPQHTRQDIVIYRPRNAGRGFYDFRLRGKRGLEERVGEWVDGDGRARNFILRGNICSLALTALPTCTILVRFSGK
jgi:hypothetical protein